MGSNLWLGSFLWPYTNRVHWLQQWKMRRVLTKYENYLNCLWWDRSICLLVKVTVNFMQLYTITSKCPNNEWEFKYRLLSSCIYQGAHYSLKKFIFHMASSSNSTNKISNNQDGGDHRRWSKMKNRYCNYYDGRRAVIRISESSKNPRRLLFCCDTCNFFQWWTPDNDEWHSLREYVQERTGAYRLSRLHVVACFVGIIIAHILAKALVVLYLWWFLVRTLADPRVTR